MNQYRAKAIVNAVQFDSEKHPWPPEVNPWPDEKGATPRDMSFGFIKRRNRKRLHVKHGDWIITDASGGKTVCASGEFEERYELVQQTKPFVHARFFR